jgi:CRISPR-associated endonuclease Cas2
LNKNRIKNLPKTVGLCGLAILISLTERGFLTLGAILEGPKLTIGRAYDRVLALKTPQEYYEILKNMHENSARTILWRLEKKGLVEKKSNKYSISKIGLTFLNKQLREGSKPKEKVWDDKWRLIAFDIPEKIKEERDWLRYYLQTFGYKPLQKSIFVGKHPLERDFMKEIIEKNLGGHIRIITIGEIDDETFLENIK